MPIHDWTRAYAGLCHHFHQAWIVRLCDALNAGALPTGFYALAERDGSGPIPRAAEDENYAAKADRVAIYHPLDEVVAVIEIVSPGNKSGRIALHHFVEKAVEFLRRGVHLLVIDPFPPGPRDPQGIHKALWDEIHEEPFALLTDKPLTLASYAAGPIKTAYVEPVAVGDVLPDMPMFLRPGAYVEVPLEATYREAFEAVPRRWRVVVEGEA